MDPMVVKVGQQVPDPDRQMTWTVVEVWSRPEVVRRCGGRCVAHMEDVVTSVRMVGTVPGVGDCSWMVHRVDVERMVKRS